MSASIEHKHLMPTFPLVAVVQPPSISGQAARHANRNSSTSLASLPVNLMTVHATIDTAVHANMVRSRMNVRKKATDVSELAALIRTQGLLQNLVGYLQSSGGVETGVVEIVAGGRRLEAIGKLIEEGIFPLDYRIPYLLVTEDEAIEISMAENRGREDMHPADVYEAMLELIKRGRSIEDIAISFNLDTLTVKRCLKLAHVSPRLLALYRNDEANFEHMMALAISDSHSAQEQAWDSFGKQTRYAHDLRRLLTARQIDVQSDRLARFVGVDAFEKAGGVVVRDLFSDSGTGYISDVPLLERLAMEKLERQRAKLEKQGFAWVELLPRADHGTLAEYGRVRTTVSELSAEQCARIEETGRELAILEQQINAADDDDDQYDVLSAHIDNLEAERKSIYDSRKAVPDPEDVALAGAVVMLDTFGNVVVKRDLIRPADKTKMRKQVGADGQDATARRAKSVHSDRLTHILTSHRTVALQAELMDRPDLAIVLLTHTLLTKLLQPHRSFDLIAKVSLSQPSLAQETEDTPATTALSMRHKEIVERLPKDADRNGLLVWLHQQPQPVLLELLAFCVASSLDATLSREGPCPAYVEVARLMNLDMSKWWKPTATGYFNLVSRERTVAVVVQAVSPQAAVPMEKMKKAEAALAAERVLSATTWLPEALRID